MRKDKDLMIYEMPTIAEFVSIGWIQEVLAWFLVRKIERKMKRYYNRIERDKWVKEKLNN